MKRRYHLHVPTLLYCLLVLAVGLVAMRAENNLLFWIFGLLFSGLVISGVLSGVMMLGVRVKRIDPPHVAVGEPLIVRYQIYNKNRFVPIFNVHIEELPVSERVTSTEKGGSGDRVWRLFRWMLPRPRSPSEATESAPHANNGWQNLMTKVNAWIMHVGPRETVHGEAIFWPVRRGEARFHRVRVWTTFPFGMIKKSVTLDQPQHTLIYPRLYQLQRGVLRHIDTPGPVGTRITSRPGGTDDYFGLREFRHSDSIRHIAWKRSAQSDQLVCIERSMPSPPRLRIVLDLTTPTKRLRVAESGFEIGDAAARELEERAISLTASLLHHADLAGYEVGLTIMGMGVHHSVRRNHWHARKLMAMLAAIDLDAPRVETARAPLSPIERAGLVIIRPDRVQPFSDRPDITYFTGRQLDKLAIGPIGRGTSSAGQMPETDGRPPSSHPASSTGVAA